MRYYPFVFLPERMRTACDRSGANGNGASSRGTRRTDNARGQLETRRFLCWTEDNRMHAAVDDRYYSYYAYDYGGERRLKLVGVNSSVDVNAEYMTAVSTLNEPTLYPSAYMVLTNKGYTKHYYAGTERVAARLGGGGLDALYHVIGNDEELQVKADMLFKQSLEQVNHRVLHENNLDCIMQNEFSKEEFGYWIDDIPHQMKAEAEIDHGQFKDMVNSMLDDINHGQEKEVYFYHSDHLGSASWITDFSGVAVQHIQYLPYGEPYINQHPFGYSERFTFTGKERDAETGYSYFGARYYDSDLSGLFLSVDPLSDKYPSLSPYAYCAWNPLKLVDPDGNDWYEYTDNTTGKKKIAWTECHSQKQLDKVHKNAEYLGLTVDDGKTYYGLMGDQVDKSNIERFNMVKCLDLAIIKRAQRDVNSEGVFNENQFVDFSNVFTDNNGAAGKRMSRSYEYGGGEATIAMNQRDMKGRFNPELHTSLSGDDNRGMGGPGAGIMAVKCPRYEIRQGSGKNSIAGISFYKKPEELARFQRMYKHISSGRVLTYSTKNGNNWNKSFY